MTSSDKDFRFMATNDLMTELQKDSIKLDDDSERKVVKMLLRLLEDKNGEVQNLAVKWWVLHAIVNYFHFMCMVVMDSVNVMALNLIVFTGRNVKCMPNNRVQAQGIFL